MPQDGNRHSSSRPCLLRYRWLRGCLWNQQLSPYSSERYWLWLTQFGTFVEAGGDFDAITQGQELDAALNERIKQDERDAFRAIGESWGYD